MMPLAHMENSKQEAKSMGRQMGGGESKTPEQVGPRPGQLGFSILRRLHRQALDTDLVLSAWDCALVRAGKWPASGVPVSAAFLFQLNLHLECLESSNLLQVIQPNTNQGASVRGFCRYNEGQLSLQVPAPGCLTSLPGLH